MARLPELVTAFAAVDGRDRTTIDYLSRVIRQAGYIPAGKRGVGGAEMTVTSAVNLLLGVNGATEPQEAPAAVERLRSLLPIGMSKHDSIPEAFAGVAAAGDFGDALEALVAAMPNILYTAGVLIKEGGFPERTAAFHLKALVKAPWTSPMNLTVTLYRFSAEIEMKLWSGQHAETATWKRIFYEKFQANADLLERGFYGDRRGDRSVAVSFTGLTLLELWRVLQEEDGAKLELRMA